ncbi:MAG TPA: tetratricopeptide repeat protein, partial [Planctomycetota bacterium]|nr:tetratricopeptide repeat protein [Planctomycetota bacterium]
MKRTAIALLLLGLGSGVALADDGVLARVSLRSDGPARVLLTEADAAIVANDPATARVKLLAALSAEPDHVGARVALAALARESGLPVEARRLVDEALARLPPNAAALNLKGLLALDDGKLDDAIAAFVAASKADPKDPTPELNLGEVAVRASDLPNAVQHYGRAVEIDPTNEIAHTRLAALHAARGEADDAIRHAEAALAKNARNPLARSALGSGLAAKGDWEPAILALEEARRSLPADGAVRQ